MNKEVYILMNKVIEEHHRYDDMPDSLLNECKELIKKCKDFAQAFNIYGIYTNLNFYRFKDDDTKVGSNIAIREHGNDNIYFAKDLAQPYLDNILGGK